MIDNKMSLLGDDLKAEIASEANYNKMQQRNCRVRKTKENRIAIQQKGCNK